MNIPTIDRAQTGANIVTLRKAAGLTVHDLQMVSGFNSPQAIYKWQNGTALPTVNNLIILRFASLDVEFLSRDRFGQHNELVTVSGQKNKSPYLHIAQVKRFLKLLPKDVHLTVVTDDESSFKPEAWEKMSNAVKVLEAAGATVILQPKVYQRYAVIDKNTLWYGGINFLGFEKAAHGAMRLCSAELAKELLDRTRTGQEVQMKLLDV